MTKISTFPASLTDIGTLPPLHSDTIRVTQATDLRGTAQFDKSKIVFQGTDFTHLVLDSIQFGNGNISDAVAITGDSFRNFVTVHLSNGDTSFSAANWTFENFIPFNPLQHDQVTVYGSAAADTITGSSMADGLLGGDGNDTLLGLDGRDYLIGGGGSDMLVGGQGDDGYRLDTVHFAGPVLELADGGRSRLGAQLPQFLAYDTVVEGVDGGIDRVEIHTTGTLSHYTLPVNVENGFIFGAGSFRLSGNSLGNELTGNEVANTLTGLDGADTLAGRGGDDVLEGGRGGDTIDGGNGSDTASYAGALSGVTVSLLSKVSQVTGAGSDILLSIENLLGSAFDDTLDGNGFDNVISGGAGADALFGDIGNDTLLGGGGADRIAGGSGQDRIEGGNGRDTMAGGSQSDTFVFGPGSGADIINGFADAGTTDDDIIDVIAYGFADVSEIGRTASGNDLVLSFADGDTVTIRDYLADHGINAILDDILIA